MTVTNKDLMDKLTTIELQNATRDEVIRQLVDDNKKHTDIIDGNGRPGLKTRVEMLTASVDALVKLTWTLGGVVGAQVIGLLFLILTHQFSFP